MEAALQLEIVEKSTMVADECECAQCQNYARDVHWLVKQLQKSHKRIAELEHDLKKKK